MHLITNLSIKAPGPTGEMTDILPEGVELTYKVSFESQKLERFANGDLDTTSKRSGKVKLTIEGNGLIPDLLRQNYLNTRLEVIPGVRLYSMTETSEIAEESSIIKRANCCSYRLKLPMMLQSFSCEHNETELCPENSSKWTLILEEV